MPVRLKLFGEASVVQLGTNVSHIRLQGHADGLLVHDSQQILMNVEKEACHAAQPLHTDESSDHPPVHAEQSANTDERFDEHPPAKPKHSPSTHAASEAHSRTKPEQSLRAPSIPEDTMHSSLDVD